MERFNLTSAVNSLTIIKYALNCNQRLHSKAMLYSARVLLVMMMTMAMQSKEKKLIMKMTTKREVFQSSIQVERSVILTPVSSTPYKLTFTAMKKIPN
jgi:hypothetical protein